MKEYLDRIGVEYRFQCYHEKRPDGCHRLADYLESFKSDWSRARSVYNMNCQENKYGPSCFKFGNYNLVGKAVAADFAEAYKSFLAGCDYGYGASCHNAGLMHHEAKIGEKRDFVKAVEYLEARMYSGKRSKLCYVECLLYNGTGWRSKRYGEGIQICTDVLRQRTYDRLCQSQSDVQTRRGCREKHGNVE